MMEMVTKTSRMPNAKDNDKKKPPCFWVQALWERQWKMLEIVETMTRTMEKNNSKPILH
jgi:hypothetical protein